MLEDTELPKSLRQPPVKPRKTLNTLLQTTSYSLGEFQCHREGAGADIILLEILNCIFAGLCQAEAQNYIL